MIRRSYAGQGPCCVPSLRVLSPPLACVALPHIYAPSPGTPLFPSMRTGGQEGKDPVNYASSTTTQICPNVIECLMCYLLGRTYGLTYLVAHPDIHTHTQIHTHTYSRMHSERSTDKQIDMHRTYEYKSRRIKDLSSSVKPCTRWCQTKCNSFPRIPGKQNFATQSIERRQDGKTLALDRTD